MVSDVTVVWLSDVEKDSNSSGGYLWFLCCCGAGRKGSGFDRVGAPLRSGGGSRMSLVVFREGDVGRSCPAARWS
jgi:hypothetical protein